MVSCLLVTDVNYGLSLQVTRLLVNLSTRKLPTKHYELL